jgi:hypothetical protein
MPGYDSSHYDPSAPVAAVTLRDPVAGAQVAAVVALDMILLNRAFRGRYLLIEAEQGILGRDVLNHLSLVLDGPGQRWWEHEPSA